MASSDSGHIRIFRDLLRHPSFISAPPSYRIVLITIMDYACYAPCQQDDHGVLIDLLPGQFLCTIRKLAELANVGKKDVEHAIARFSQIEILGQEVRHRKTIFTILWGMEIKTHGTKIGTTLGQLRDIKEVYNTNNVVVVTREPAILLKVEKLHTSGSVITASLEELFAYSVRTRKDWTTEEIEKAWIVLCEYPSPITDWMLFIQGTIKKFRTLPKQKQEENKCKSQKSYQINKKTQKKLSETDNVFYSENGTSESPLAKFAALNGLK